MASSQYDHHFFFSSEWELESEAEEQGRIGNADSCQCGECKPMAVWLHIRKVCLVRTLTKFLKDYVKGKNALQHQAVSKWFVRKNQYYMLHYEPLITYMVILWKIWAIVHTDLQDASIIVLGWIIFLGKVFAKSYHHALYGKYELSTRQIMMPMYLLWREKKMKSVVGKLMTKYFVLHKIWTLSSTSITEKYMFFQ